MPLVFQDEQLQRLSGPPEAAFVVETIGLMPPGVLRQKFQWFASRRSAPFRPWTFGTDVVTKRTDYPGTVHNPTEQIINVRFSEFTLSGRWSDKWNYPGFAIDTLRAFEAMVNLGVMVRVSYKSIFVNGIITGFTPSYYHDGEIGYSFTFSPHVREPGQPVQGSPRTVLNTEQLLGEIVRIEEQIDVYHAEAPRFFVAGSLWQDVEDIINDWSDTITILDNVISQRIILPDLEPSSALKRIASLFRLIRTHAEAVDDLLYTARSDTHLTYASGLNILRFDVWAKGILSYAKKLAVFSERASRETLMRADPPAMALYRPSADEHLMKISNQFYGSPENWKRIATRNNLGSALTMTGTEILIIPEAVARQ